jgi:hypothetical protein
MRDYQSPFQSDYNSHPLHFNLLTRLDVHLEFELFLPVLAGVPAVLIKTSRDQLVCVTCPFNKLKNPSQEI